MSKQQKVLTFDIETAPMLAYVWDLRDQNIALNQIHTDSRILAFSAKWFGKSEVIYKEAREAKDEKALLEAMWKLLDEAEIVITQNGKNFDSPKLNARFMLYGMKPPSHYKHWDTYQLVSKVARFTSNKLEYLTDKLCTKYKKLSHKRFPGFSLWKACLAGNKAAWDEMKRYNVHDVLSTEELYTKIRAWAPESVPSVYTTTDKAKECGTCGFTGRMREGDARRTKKYVYRQHSCLKCGAWQTGERV